VEAKSPTSRLLICPVNNDNGVYTATFQPDEAGEWKISVTYEGEHIQGSPFTCFVFDPHAVKVGQYFTPFLLLTFVIYFIFKFKKSCLILPEPWWVKIIQSLAILLVPVGVRPSLMLCYTVDRCRMTSIRSIKALIWSRLLRKNAANIASTSTTMASK